MVRCDCVKNIVICFGYECFFYYVVFWKFYGWCRVGWYEEGFEWRWWWEWKFIFVFLWVFGICEFGNSRCGGWVEVFERDG